MNRDPDVRFSIVLLTYARDFLLNDVLGRLKANDGGRDDYEVLLVDNNDEPADRERLLEQFPFARYLGGEGNRGVSARNLGIEAARGTYILVVDDDVLMETPGYLDRFEQYFEAEPELGCISTRKRVRGETRRRVDLIPHTRKDVDLDESFLTFRFVGGCVGFRRDTLRQVGGFYPEFFYGIEEVELAFRIVDGGWKIRYVPDILVEELEHPAGRKPIRDSQTDRLSNKYIMTWMHMPFPQNMLNYALFTPYLYYRVRGQVRVGAAAKRFFAWLRRSDRPARKPLSADARAYIRACGGSLWR
ncbi:glycosyltransferase [Stakelama sp. CBK3Z-3]|uniref:Glycosyltransferase n=1 Tax=Stakelama flava TaxID=2860338 RepID=A0ABS6XIA9_9SPHN|nr:glycosyltransferase [Stakelama flava]